MRSRLKVWGGYALQALLWLFGICVLGGAAGWWTAAWSVLTKEAP